MTIVSGKASDMYKADACILQASAFFRCRKITDANVLDGFFKRLEIYPEMKTERVTAVKRSVLYEYHRICVLRSLMQPLLENPDEAVPQQPEMIRTAGTSR